MTSRTRKDWLCATPRWRNHPGDEQERRRECSGHKQRPEAALHSKEPKACLAACDHAGDEDERYRHELLGSRMS
jgi:hypothetical protein